MDYSIEHINEEIIKLAKEISEEVPYWMHPRPVSALKRALLKCQQMEELAMDVSILNRNKETILNCLAIFKQMP